MEQNLDAWYRSTMTKVSPQIWSVGQSLPSRLRTALVVSIYVSTFILYGESHAQNIASESSIIQDDQESCIKVSVHIYWRLRCETDGEEQNSTGPIPRVFG